LGGSHQFDPFFCGTQLPSTASFIGLMSMKKLYWPADWKPQRAVFNDIGRQLQLPGESGTHFAYLGLATDFIGVDVHQRQPYIELSVENCISRLSRCHGWDTPPTHEPDSAFATPLSPSAVDML
jgi:hypothetical protein